MMPADYQFLRGAGVKIIYGKIAKNNSLMPADEWEAYDDSIDEPDDPDAYRAMLDDPAREDFCS